MSYDEFLLLLAESNKEKITVKRVSGERAVIVSIYPSSMGKHWWHVSVADSKTMDETYTNTPIATSRLQSFFQNLKDAVENGIITKEKHKLVKYNFFGEKGIKALNTITNVYVLQCEFGGAVKIGKADDVESRINVIQKCCPYKLQLLYCFKDVQGKFEFSLHSKFKQHRLHGEWFSSEVLPDIQALYATMAN